MKKVFLSAGHGGTDSGAIGNGLKEKEVNLTMMMSCKNVLEKNGITVVCSRLKDENDPVESEVIEANNSNSDIAVSFHNNAGGGDGFEAFYYTTSKDGKRLAEIIEKHITKAGQNSRGLKSGNHLYFVRKTKMPAVLVETFFLDNSKDCEIANTKNKQEKWGELYALAILEFFGKGSKGSEAVAKPSKDYEAIGKQFELCMSDIEKLSSFKTLKSML